ncbi:hypothetical protein PIROE2DRAFT_19780 [Piromyces sp. E2]|nr:hypothetical protein PIROE2DRAFT_19780 [Piromyces sp. E2]|eukprot:OUM68977.1 hypothetical protein PIROE2DRAFT_19780 [Piromyces sp. E2]
MKIKIFGLSFLVALTKADKYTFNVVSLSPGSSICVKWDNNVQLLTSTIKPLFTGTVEANNLSKYKYAICDETGEILEEETVERTYTPMTPGINEVYNRQNKDVTIPSLPEPFKPMFKMGTEKFPPFPKNEIYNVYAECEEDGYNDLVHNPFFEDYSINEKNINCTVSIISSKTKYKGTGLMHILGFGSRRYRKLSWSLKFDKKFMGRRAIKLRAMANDPTLMREKLSIELFKSSSVPVQEGTYARLFINGDTFGLYGFIDSLSSNWISNYIHGDDKAKIGTSYNIFSSPPDGPFASLRYLGDDYLNYSEDGIYEVDEYEKDEIKIDDEPAKWKHLIEFTKLYDEWVKNYGNDNSQKAVDELEKFLNIESVLRVLAIESLLVALDNFWLVMSNAALYYNPERKNYQILPYDFDEAMVGDKSDPLIDRDTYISDCITWANKEESIDRFFVNNLLSHPQIKERYDVIIAKISRESFTPNQVSPYLHAVADLIRDDVEWNFNSIDGLNFYSDGLVNHFTLEEFNGNIDKTPVDYDSSRNSDDAPFGIVQWTELRSNSCKDYTKTVDTTKNANISDDVDVSDSSSSKPSSSGSLTTISVTFSTFFFIAFQFLYFLFF